MKHLIRALGLTVSATAFINAASAQPIIFTGNNKEILLNVAIMNTASAFSKSDTAAMLAGSDFKSRFGNITDVKWKKEPDRSLIAFFEKNQKTAMAYYNPEGYWNHTIYCYGSDQLLPSIKESIRKEYSNYNILYVDEVNTASCTVYLVYIDDATRMITIRFCNNEMDKIQDLAKK